MRRQSCADYKQRTACPSKPPKQYRGACRPAKKHCGARSSPRRAPHCPFHFPSSPLPLLHVSRHAVTKQPRRRCSLVCVPAPEVADAPEGDACPKSSASRLGTPPLAVRGSKRGGSLVRRFSPFASPPRTSGVSRHVAPRLRLGAGLCAGGAAQAPQLVKPGKTPVYPSDYHGNRA